MNNSDQAESDCHEENKIINVEDPLQISTRLCYIWRRRSRLLSPISVLRKILRIFKHPILSARGYRSNHNDVILLLEGDLMGWTFTSGMTCLLSGTRYISVFSFTERSEPVFPLTVFCPRNSCPFFLRVSLLENADQSVETNPSRSKQFLSLSFHCLRLLIILFHFFVFGTAEIKINLFRHSQK